MKHLLLVLNFLFVFCLKTALSQGVLEYHYGAGISVQRMPDGATFRFLQGNDGDEFLTEFSAYQMPEITKADTCVWQYIEDEDQLYIMAWDKSKSTKKHELKFAVAWRVTSGNPRYGKVSVPANLQFEGFGKNQAYFTDLNKNEKFTLFFYEKYIPGLAIIEYTLKTTTKITDTNPASAGYYRIENNFNFTDSKVPNPYGPSARAKMEAEEEFKRDSEISTVLQAIKQKYAAQAIDENWGSPRFTLENYRRDITVDENWNQRRYALLYFFIEDKNYSSTKLNGMFVSEHPELIENKPISFERFYHENGVSGWRIAVKHFPFLQLKLNLNLSSETPILIIDYNASAGKQIENCILPESYYPSGENVKAIAAADDPESKAIKLWALYKMNKNMECTAEEMKHAFIEMYESLGYSYDYYDYSQYPSKQIVTGNVSNKYQTIKAIVISTYAPKSLQVRLGEQYEYGDVEMDELDRLDGQRQRVFIKDFEFKEGTHSFDYSFEPNTSEQSYIIFFSHEKK